MLLNETPESLAGQGAPAREGLTEYGHGLVIDTKKMLEAAFSKMSPAEADQEEQSFREINRSLVRVSLFFLLSEMGVEERAALFRENPDIFTIIKTSAMKAGVAKDQEAILEADLAKARAEGGGSNFMIANNLHLLDNNSPAQRLKQEILRQLGKKKEAYEAYSYLLFSEK